jgi:Mn-containing catalase
VRDLRADIAAEAGARQTYEALVKLAPDEGSKKALTFLLTREISHTHMFMKALESLGKLTDPLFGNIQPDETVDLYFNLSKDGPLDLRGPWNSEPAFRYVEKPEPQGQLPLEVQNPDDERHHSLQHGHHSAIPGHAGSTRETNPAGQHTDLNRSAAERNPAK